MKRALLSLTALSFAALSLGALDPRVEGPPPPPLAEHLTEERSLAPADDKEWAEATRVTVTRAPKECGARRLREWVRIDCTMPFSEMGISLIAGSVEGVSFTHEPWGGLDSVMFPVRRGDRRVFEIMKGVSSPNSFSAYSFESDVAFVISEVWLPDESEPSIVVD